MFVVRLAERVERLLRRGTIGVAAAENRACPLESADRMSTERDESRARPVGSDLSHRQSAVDRVEREREERRFQRLSERRRVGFARADANSTIAAINVNNARRANGAKADAKANENKVARRTNVVRRYASSTSRRPFFRCAGKPS